MSLKRWLRKRKENKYKKLAFKHDKPLMEPTDSELASINELRQVFLEFSECKYSGNSDSEKEWIHNTNRLRELVLNGNVREFLRWDVIIKTMFVVYADFIEPEIKYLEQHPQWSSRWKDAIKEDPIGHPVPNWMCPSSSSNLIHHTYHICQFEDIMNKNICEYDCVIEFGGGYGSLCRLVHKLGFKGKYYIFDFPTFSELQRFYLSRLGLKAQTGLGGKEETEIFCISEIEQLQQVVSELDSERSLFIATWSLSETSLDYRKRLLPIISKLNSFLIAYQKTFNEVDNTAFFEELPKSINKVKWKDVPIEAMGYGQRYLLGTH